MNKKILFAVLVLCLSLVSCSTFQGEQSAETHNNRGTGYFDIGNFEKAISEWNRAIEIDPQYADAYVNRGDAYLAKGEFDQALADFDKAITINPNDAYAYLFRGMCLIDIGENQRAIPDLERALELDLHPVDQELARELLDEASQ